MQNKHIIKLSFVAIFISIIANIVLYRQFIVDDIILYEVSQNHKHLVTAYKNTIWDSYHRVTKKLLEKPYRTHDESRQNLVLLKKDTDKFFQDYDVLKVQIFDKNGNEFFTSNDTQIRLTRLDQLPFYNYIIAKINEVILSTFITHNGLLRAYNGEIVNTLLPNVEISKSDKVITLSGSIIANYIPIVTNTNTVELVLVFYTDSTSLLQSISGLEHKILAILSVLILIFCGILIYNTNYAQKIIAEQFKVNKFLEAAKSKAEDENSAKTEFLANVSHELRTPLNAIIGFSEIILSEHGKNINPETYTNYINDIHNSGKHLLGVINDILDYSKASTHNLKVDLINIDLNKVIKSSMRLVEPKALEMQINLIADIPTNYIVIKADSKRLKQALLNLLSNSLKFTHASGSITLSVKLNREKRLVYIKVIDTGIGIAEHDIHKALSSFGQVDNSLSRKYDGTGLGLPLTKKLVELMNGTFEIMSTVGIGTTVTLTFEYEDSDNK